MFVTLLLVLVITLLFVSGASKIIVNRHSDPDVGLSMVELVTRRGYDIETHYVVTEDDYILTVFRIPGKKGSPPVLLQHGLFDSSFTWISNYKDQSFAYLLSDAGFDVWMGNNRGNYYGRNHTTLDPDAKAPNPFWQFSYDQMAMFDAPAMIEYVLKINGASTTAYAGHSEGTMQFFAGSSLGLPAFKKVNLFVGLAPVGSVANIKSPELIALAHTDLAQNLMNRGLQEFMRLRAPENRLDSEVCKLSPRVCSLTLDTLCGPTVNLNISRLQVYFGETPAGTSTMNVNHFVQGIVDRKARFRMYDFGSDEANAAHYNGANEPPIYDLTKFNVPSVLFSGKRDWMADPKDVRESLIEKIPGKYIVQHNVEEGFAHLDYVWSPDAAKKVYLPAIDLMKQYADKSN